MSDKVPLASVVMSVFNGERYLPDALDSIRGQTFSDFEFIIVDDGSTDSTSKILRDYTRSDERVRVVTQDRVGLTMSLNKGIILARGEWIARQDADDISDSERLRSQLEFLDSNPAIGVLGTFARIIDEEGNSIRIVEHATQDIDIRFKLLRDNSFSHGSVVFSRRVFEQAGGYDEDMTYCQDYDLWCRMSLYTGLANLHSVLYSWRDVETNISNRKALEQARFRDQISLRHCTRSIRQGLVALSTREDSSASIVDVSAIICTRNRHDDVVRCISSILDQDRVPREIIVVDSSEDTRLGMTLGELLPGQRSRIVTRYIRATSGLTHQRNVGVRESTGDILLFLDDDMILYDGFVREILEIFQRRPENIGGVMGNIVNLHRDDSMWNLIKRLFFVYSFGDGRFQASGAALWPNGLPVLMEVEFLCGGQTAYRRRICEEFGFDEEFFSGYCVLEDVDFSYRVSRRYKNFYCSKALCFHNNMSLPARTNPEAYKQMMLVSHAYHFHKNVPKTLFNRVAFFLSMFFIKHQKGIQDFVWLFYRVKYRLATSIAAISSGILKGLALLKRATLLVGLARLKGKPGTNEDILI